MNPFQDFLFEDIATLLGWNFLNLTWQITIIGLLAKLVGRNLRDNSRAKYATATISLSFIGMLPFVNLVVLSPKLSKPETLYKKDELATVAWLKPTLQNARTGAPELTSRQSPEYPGMQNAELPISPSESSDRNTDMTAEQFARPKSSPLSQFGSHNLTPDRFEAGAIPDRSESQTKRTRQRRDTLRVRGALREHLNITMPWVGFIWVACCMFVASRPLLGLLHAYRISVQARRELREIESQVSNLAQRLKISRRIRCGLLESLEVPTVVGIYQPLVLFPSSNFQDLSRGEREAVLLHELAHVKRFDNLANLIQTGIETMLFWHPVVWWLSSSVRQERENCCDDVAIEHSYEKSALAHALYKIESSRQREPVPGLNLTGGDTMRRIRRLTKSGSNKRSPSLLQSIAGVLLIFFIAMGSIPIGQTIVRANFVPTRLTSTSTSTTQNQPNNPDSQAGDDEVSNTRFSDVEIKRVRVESSANSPLGEAQFSTSDLQRIKQLQAVFPQAGQGLKGQEPGAWLADLTLFFEQGESTVRIMVNTQLGLWSEGKGDWQLPEDLGPPVAAADVVFNNAFLNSAVPNEGPAIVERKLLTNLAELLEQSRLESISPHLNRQTFETAEDLKKLAPETESLRYTGRHDWGPEAIDDASLEMIATRFPKLRHLEIDFARKVTAEGFASIAKITKLHSLRIRFAAIAEDDEARTEVAQALANMPELRVLDVSYTPGLTGNEAVAELIKGKLEQLVLGRHAAGGISAPSLVSQIQDSKVQSIYVTDSHLFLKDWGLDMPTPFVKIQDLPELDYFGVAIKAKRNWHKIEISFRQFQYESDLNERCYQANHERLASQLKGEWVAIVDGELLSGFDSIHAASEAADEKSRLAIHRFIFQAGMNAAPEEFDTSAWSTRPTWHQIGIEFRARHRINVSPQSWSVDESRLDASMGFGLLFITSPGTAADGKPWFLPSRPGRYVHGQRPFVASSMLRQQMTLPAEDALMMGLYRYSIPESSRARAYDVECPRVRVRVAEPKLGIDELVTAFVIPYEFTSRFRN